MLVATLTSCLMGANALKKSIFIIANAYLTCLQISYNKLMLKMCVVFVICYF
jgi:hypothetical protein